MTDEPIRATWPEGLREEIAASESIPLTGPQLEVLRMVHDARGGDVRGRRYATMARVRALGLIRSDHGTERVTRLGRRELYRRIAP